jgi:hypothetical protein
MNNRKTHTHNVMSSPQEFNPFAFAATQMDGLLNEDVEMMVASDNTFNPFSLGAA